MTLKDFEALVTQALDNLPEEFARAMDNVEIVVEIWPTAQDLMAGKVTHGTLFGLYHGIPRTRRGHYAGALPDKISIFAGPIVAAFGESPDEVRDQVRKTVLHEIAHHFGLDEHEIRNAMSPKS